MEADSDVTSLLAAYGAGQKQALNQLLPAVYDELRRLARVRRWRFGNQEAPGTTSLVHEAYLNLVDASRSVWSDRRHFLYLASVSMRNLLIDHARSQARARRGGGLQHVPIDDAVLLAPERCEDFLAIEEALARLEQHDQRLARIVECRFFGGLTAEETADALDVSEITVRRGWSTARAWLYKELKSSPSLEAAEPEHGS